jgi:hypothetical protein
VTKREDRYTWEHERRGMKVEKRLNSFWGPKTWLEEIRNVKTLQKSGYHPIT